MRFPDTRHYNSTVCLRQRSIHDTSDLMASRPSEEIARCKPTPDTQIRCLSCCKDVFSSRRERGAAEQEVEVEYDSIVFQTDQSVASALMSCVLHVTQKTQKCLKPTEEKRKSLVRANRSSSVSL
ncbi:hypothetical protein IRJ41_019759 [Triplophysa rosa]|uniref:Uncharacterized protein n=1 Tax=Triplophysa rosa TaxID=992332 RepID=A0A9W7TVW1_TRIRA|nr:hypothetical protein IRJ41_019759 [Triplophysa rosa]